MVNKLDISEKGIELIKLWEGFKPQIYKDVVGLLTIGVGHLVTTSEKTQGYVFVEGTKLPLDRSWTSEEVNLVLKKDLSRFVDSINKLVKVPLTQNQFDALVSFSFNVGVGNFSNSTLLKVINQGKLNLVQSELRKWVKAGGKTVQGLVNRRNNEIKLWEGKL